MLHTIRTIAKAVPANKIYSCATAALLNFYRPSNVKRTPNFSFLSTKAMANQEFSNPLRKFKLVFLGEQSGNGLLSESEKPLLLLDLCMIHSTTLIKYSPLIIGYHWN
jgi:hypothetical protein